MTYRLSDNDEQIVVLAYGRRGKLRMYRMAKGLATIEGAQ